MSICSYLNVAVLAFVKCYWSLTDRSHYTSVVDFNWWLVVNKQSDMRAYKMCSASSATCQPSNPTRGVLRWQPCPHTRRDRAHIWAAQGSVDVLGHSWQQAPLYSWEGVQNYPGMLCPAQPVAHGIPPTAWSRTTTRQARRHTAIVGLPGRAAVLDRYALMQRLQQW